MLRNSLFRGGIFCQQRREQHTDDHLQRHLDGGVLQRDADGLEETPVRQGAGVVVQADELGLAQVNTHLLRADPEGAQHRNNAENN